MKNTIQNVVSVCNSSCMVVEVNSLIGPLKIQFAEPDEDGGAVVATVEAYVNKKGLLVIKVKNGDQTKNNGGKFKFKFLE